MTIFTRFHSAKLVASYPVSLVETGEPGTSRLHVHVQNISVLEMLLCAIVGTIPPLLPSKPKSLASVKCSQIAFTR